MINPTPESPITTEAVESRDEIVNQGVNEALEGIRQKYEVSENLRENLPYHNTEHTQGVINRVNTILKTIQENAPESVSDKDIELAVLAAAFHDTVQNWEEKVDGSIVKRQRFAGQNEDDSAGLAVGFMTEQNLKAGQDIFSPQDKEIVGEAIRATVPGWNPEAGTVIQPNLTAESSLVARAIALADVNTAGIEGPQALLYDTANLFREDNLDILDAIASGQSLSDEQKQSYRDRMMAWIRTQSGFIQGRKQLLDSELVGIPEEALEAVKALFNKFDETVERIKEVTNECEKMEFEELAFELGYEFLNPSA